MSDLDVSAPPLPGIASPQCRRYRARSRFRHPCAIVARRWRNAIRRSSVAATRRSSSTSGTTRTGAPPPLAPLAPPAPTPPAPAPLPTLPPPVCRPPIAPFTGVATAAAGGAAPPRRDAAPAPPDATTPPPPRPPRVNTPRPVPRPPRPRPAASTPLVGGAGGTRDGLLYCDTVALRVASSHTVAGMGDGGTTTLTPSPDMLLMYSATPSCA